MRRFVRLAALFAGIALLVPGCATQFDSAAEREAATSQARFDRALGDIYLALAEAERDESDWRDADAFLMRARRAFAGDPPTVELPADRNLPQDIAAEAATIRAEILRFEADGARLTNFQAAAETQGAFECWLQEAEEGHQQADIKACKDHLDEALLRLRAGAGRSLIVLLPNEDGKPSAITVARDGAAAVLDTPLTAAVVDPNAPPAVVGELEQQEVDGAFGDALAQTPAPPSRFILYFVTGTSELTPESAADLPRVLENASGRPAPRVDVVGHTDRVGAADVNARLARDRAQSVADALADAGVPSDQIIVASFGETDNVVPTADNVPEPRNRRVEVLVR